jgi:hypothetical protein
VPVDLEVGSGSLGEETMLDKEVALLKSQKEVLHPKGKGPSYLVGQEYNISRGPEELLPEEDIRQLEDSPDRDPVALRIAGSCAEEDGP